MSARINYTAVGIFVVTLAAGLIAVLLWLSAGARKNYTTYSVYMDEAVAGLSVQAPVKYNGVEVGYVSSIQLNPENPQQVLLTLNIETGTPVTESTHAVLMAQGITGITYVGLKAKTPNAPLLKPLKGNQYAVIPADPSLLVELDSALRDIVHDIDEITARSQKLLSDVNLKNIELILKDFQQLSHTFSQNSPNINATFDQLRSGSETLLPQMNAMIQNLNTISQSLNEILNRVSQHPSVLIRGTSPLPKGPGE